MFPQYLILLQLMFIYCVTCMTRGRPRGRNFALNGTQGEVGVSLKKKKKLIFILSSHKRKLW